MGTRCWSSGLKLLELGAVVCRDRDASSIEMHRDGLMTMDPRGIWCGRMRMRMMQGKCGRGMPH